MRVKRYVADTAESAVAQLRAELGPEAIILHTQPLRSKGILGFMTRPRFEVLAAVDDTMLPSVPARSSAPLRRAEPGPLRAVKAEVPPLAVGKPPRALAAVGATALAATPPPEQALSTLQQDVGQMAALMGRLLRRLDLPGEAQRLEPELRAVYAALIEAGVPDEPALRLAGRVRRQIQRGRGQYAEATDLAVGALVRDLGKPQPIAARRGSRRVVALTGPTGAGKTTTLAKLAAHHTLGRRLKVALITADTYRIAAVEQLRTYAEIIGVPLYVVGSAGELPAALERCADVDLILADTAGRSHRSQGQMEELAATLRALSPDETYLVLALTASGRDLENATAAYMPLGFDRFLFTKLDEACAPGVAYHLVQHFERPLSYVTGGQIVPDDIEVANPEALARLILGVS